MFHNTRFGSSRASLLFMPVLALPAVGQVTTRISQLANGAPTSELSRSCDISASGRFVAFMSPDDGLAGASSTGQIFVCDRDPDGNGVFDEGNAALELASASFGGGPGNSASDAPAISRNGQFVVFVSASSNLVNLADNNGPFPDVYVRDRASATTLRATGLGAIPQPDNFVTGVAISDDGRYVMLQTLATNFAPSDFNARPDVYRLDLVTQTFTLVTASTAGQPANLGGYSGDLSADGRWIAFHSESTNLTSTPVATQHVYLRDMLAGVTAIVSRATSGTLANQASQNASLSADGRFVAFSSYATNLNPLDTTFNEDVYLRDTALSTTELVSVNSFGAKAAASGSVQSSEPDVSDDGDRIVFWSTATNLWWNDAAFTDVYVRTRSSGQTRRASRSSAGVGGNANSANFSGLACSGDGRSVAFASDASNLVPLDSNGVSDVFVRALGDDPGVELGYALVGSNGLIPTLEASGRLATGEQATLTLHHAQPNKLSVVFRSQVLNPHPFFGGTLVLGGPWARTTIQTDATGSASFSLGGGGGPADLYLHWLVRDGALAQHTGFSNALRVTLLP